MKNRLFSILILLLTLSSCNLNFNKDSELIHNARNDTTVLSYVGFNYGLKLRLIGNDDFIYEYHSRACTGGGEYETVFGKYICDQSRLTLIPDSVIFVLLPFFDHTNPKKYTLKYGIDSLKIKTEYDLLEWSNTLYLISPEKDFRFRTHPDISLADFDVDSLNNERNDYHTFADYFNTGLEPETHGKYLTSEIDTVDKSNYPELDMSQIPQEWRYLFLKNPVEATIVNMSSEQRSWGEDEYYTIYKVILDKGKRDNIRVGIEFFDESMNKYIKIVSAGDDNCIGITQDDFIRGEKVKTNWKK